MVFQLTLITNYDLNYQECIRIKYDMAIFCNDSCGIFWEWGYHDGVYQSPIIPKSIIIDDNEFALMFKLRYSEYIQ